MQEIGRWKVREVVSLGKLVLSIFCEVFACLELVRCSRMYLITFLSISVGIFPIIQSQSIELGITRPHSLCCSEIG